MKRFSLIAFPSILLFFSAAGFLKRPVSQNHLVLHFRHFVDQERLVLNDSTHPYQNAHGDGFYVTTFKYYISNFVLTRTNGDTVNLPQTYLLVNAADSSSFIQELTDIPAGKYKAMSFVIGIDSSRNFSGAQSGCLDPAKGMFWTWKSGYIYVKMEGVSQQSTDKKNRLVFHIGGAISPNNTIRFFSQDLPKKLKIKSEGEQHLGIDVNLAALFRGKTTVDFASLNFTMGGPKSVVVADNYANGLFTISNYSGQ